MNNDYFNHLLLHYGAEVAERYRELVTSPNYWQDLSCPKCGGKLRKGGCRVTKTGRRNQIYRCCDCDKSFSCRAE